MNHSRSFPKAVLWNFVASLLGALAMFVFVLILLGLMVAGFATSGDPTMVVLFVPVVLAGIVVSIAVYQRFLRRFYADKLGIVIGLGEAVAAIIVVGLIGGGLGTIIENLGFGVAGQVVSILIGLVAIPLWFLKRAERDEDAEPVALEQ